KPGLQPRRPGRWQDRGGLPMTSLLACACLLAAPVACQLPTVKDFALPDGAGKKHAAADWKGKKAVVLIFLGTDCPVSNFYCPDSARLAKECAGKGVASYGVHADPDVTAQDAHATRALPRPRDSRHRGPARRRQAAADRLQGLGLPLA